MNDTTQTETNIQEAPRAEEAQTAWNALRVQLESTRGKTGRYVSDLFGDVKLVADRSWDLGEAWLTSAREKVGLKKTVVQPVEAPATSEAD